MRSACSAGMGRRVTAASSWLLVAPRRSRIWTQPRAPWGGVLRGSSGTREEQKVKRAAGGAVVGRRASAAALWLVAPRGGAAYGHSPAPLSGAAAVGRSYRASVAL